MRIRLLRPILVVVLALAIVTTACGSEATSISSDNGHLKIGRLCNRIAMMSFEEEQLRTELLLVFACEEVWR